MQAVETMVEEAITQAAEGILQEMADRALMEEGRQGKEGEGQ